MEPVGFDTLRVCPDAVLYEPVTCPAQGGNQLEQSMLLTEIKAYWTERAEGYSAVNQEELRGCQRGNWSAFLDGRIMEHFPGIARGELHILDIGAGPGFLSIILAELGYQVTAADYTEAMLAQACLNAGELSERIRFVKEDAHRLTMPDETFDVVLSRNLTWNLEHPGTAYASWARVLKEGGLLLNFDANWYRYLFDGEKRKEYEADRKKVAENAMEDYNIGENFDRMERIALKMPLSPLDRPNWDVELLKGYGMEHVLAEGNIGDILYSEKEKINYASTPMFCIQAVKGRHNGRTI